ncbi:DNA-directed primase/polymerase protein-like [Bacillus rossius redtenbacheri]|uniref:DNA-directed primase/polymerase protein-like n=1 Tax=Bacillus rossius redtenbacheri TaxID=93214 RepID=UPI002FDD7CA0
MMENASLTFPTASFYGQRKLRDILRFSAIDSEKNLKKGTSLPPQIVSINGPSKTWQVFRSQAKALAFARSRRNGLMTFAFQDDSGNRLFLVTNPCVFWFYDELKQPHQRCSYEIISEHSPSKLYFDLEFAKECNSECNGVEMIEVFLKIVSFYLQKKWQLSVNRSHIVDLDSSSPDKFSRHLIYEIPGCVFKDNLHVGNFVKDVCSQLKHFIHLCDSDYNINKSAAGGDNQDLNKISNLYDVSLSDICKLFVFDKNGKKKLFCDEGVYTRNRQFRIYKSTKHGKNSPLVLSQENQFQIDTEDLKKHALNEAVFLHSLVTYIPQGDHLRILDSLSVESSTSSMPQMVLPKRSPNVTTESPYPEVDQFVRSLIRPNGKIIRTCFFSTSNIIVYDIVGFRYCENIGREHCSNNIKYVFYLAKLCYYQKCYDPDCRDYRSPMKDLPTDLMFCLQNDGEDEPNCVGYFGIPKDELEMLEGIDKDEYNFDDWLCKDSSGAVSGDCESSFPDYGVSDFDMLQLPESKNSK